MMKWILPVALIFVQWNWALAADLSRWKNRSLGQLIEKVQTLERLDNERVKEIVLKHRQKCDKTSSGIYLEVGECYLLESEVLPEGQGRLDRVILFRGERGRYDLPLTSGLLRYVLDGQSSLCPDVCSLGLLINNFYREAEKLNYFSDRYNDQGGIQFNEGEGFKFRDEGAAQHPENKNPTSALSYFVTEHIVGNQISGVRGESATGNLDPFISLSTDPDVALAFGRPNAQGSLGRIFMISVPKEKFGNLKREDCGKRWNNPHKIFSFYDCMIDYDSYREEFEFDAFVYLPPQYLLDVFNIDLNTHQIFNAPKNEGTVH